MHVRPTPTEIFTLNSPADTHWKTISCQEADCQAYQKGWKTVLDLRTDLGRRQEFYIRTYSGRNFKVEKVADDMLKFVFPPGQTCFRAAQHRIQIREENFLVFDGRGKRKESLQVEHKKPGLWVEHFSESLDKIRKE